MKKTNALMKKISIFFRLKRIKILCKIVIILGLIAIIILSTFFDAIKCWININEKVINLICWLIGFSGAWIVSDRIGENTKSRQTNAIYGFYFNLQTYLIILKSKISNETTDPYDFYFLKDPDKHQKSKAKNSGKKYINNFVSDSLNFFKSQQNVVPPYLNNKELEEWDKSLINIIEFLSCLEGIKYEHYHAKYEANEYENYKNNIINSINTILGQIREFRATYF